MGCSVAALTLETIFLYAPYRRLGPLFVVLQKLGNDILAFFALFVLIALAYGAALYSVLYPLNSFHGYGIVSDLESCPSAPTVYRYLFKAFFLHATVELIVAGSHPLLSILHPLWQHGTDVAEHECEVLLHLLWSLQKEPGVV
jgi:hypothetical protein